MKSWIKYLIFIIIISLASVIYYEKVYIPKNTFKTISPSRGELKVTISGIGNVGAKNIYVITAQSGGKILKILTDEGKWVKKGDLLIVMDGVDLIAQLEGANATLQKAKFEVDASVGALKNEQVQKVLIQKTYNRYEKLNSLGYVTKAEYDKAEADLQSINVAITTSLSHINSSKAEVLHAQKSAEALEIRIEKLKVYSPIDGYVVSRDVEETQDILPTTTILKIVDPKTLWVETNIDERISSQIKPNQKAKITLRSHPNKLYNATVTRIDALSDAVTLERKVDVSFDTIPEPFYINAQALVKIEVKKYEDIFKIPLNLLVERNGKLGIWITKDGHAYFQNIKKIAQNDNEIAISDINKDTKIIIPDASKKPLRDGMKIRL